MPAPGASYPQFRAFAWTLVPKRLPIVPSDIPHGLGSEINFKILSGISPESLTKFLLDATQDATRNFIPDISRSSLWDFPGIRSGICSGNPSGPPPGKFCGIPQRTASAITLGTPRSSS